jgi:hypothetical protein
MERLHIYDDDANWLRWSKLVKKWIDDDKPPHKSRPTTVKALKQQLREAKVRATVEGGGKRPVKIYQYPDGPTAPLEIPIPSVKMLKAKLKLVTAGPYPRALMPSFYDIADGGAPRVRLSKQKALDFAMRRVGEYTVNECC